MLIIFFVSQSFLDGVQSSSEIILCVIIFGVKKQIA
jgi:hypothetical protein